MFRRRLKVDSMTVAPFSERYCLGVIDPIRRPMPAAGKIAQIVIINSSALMDLGLPIPQTSSRSNE